MKRGLRVIALGVGFLIALTWLGTFITSYVPTRPTPQVATTQVGPYDVTLRVDPNPPVLDQPATLTISLLQHTSQQPVNGARMSIDGTMTEMLMDSQRAVALAQGQGIYKASLSFSMSGLWQLQIEISTPGQPTLNAIFSVTTA